MKNKKNFWRDIEADDKALAKVNKMIEKKEAKEFEKWEKRQRKEPYFWREKKSAGKNWL